MHSTQRNKRTILLSASASALFVFNICFHLHRVVHFWHCTYGHAGGSLVALEHVTTNQASSDVLPRPFPPLVLPPASRSPSPASVEGVSERATAIPFGGSCLGHCMLLLAVARLRGRRLRTGTVLYCNSLPAWKVGWRSSRWVLSQQTEGLHMPKSPHANP